MDVNVTSKIFFKLILKQVDEIYDFNDTTLKKKSSTLMYKNLKKSNFWNSKAKKIIRIIFVIDVVSGDFQ